MADPHRLLEDGATDFEAKLLSAGRRDAPLEGNRKQILAGLGLAVVASSMVTGTTAGAASSVLAKPALFARLASLGKGTLVKWGLVSSAGAMAVWAGAQWMPTADQKGALTKPSSSGRVAAAPAAPTPSSTALELGTPTPADEVRPALQESPAANNTSVREVPAPRVASSAAGQTLSAELALLEASRRALLSGDSKRSLGLLDEYARKYPRPHLSSEAQVLRIEALVAQGERNKAAELGRVFLARHGQGPFARRVRSLISTER